MAPPPPMAPPPLAAPPPTSSHPMQTRSKSGIFRPRYPVDLTTTALLSALSTVSEPRGFKSAMKSSAWLAAMQEEIDALRSNDTWDLVPRPSGINVVGS